MQPCSATYRTAFSTCRLLSLTFPRCTGNALLIRSHCASVSSIDKNRSTENLPIVRTLPSLVFENSPTWFWLHALKPVTNLEATGYSLGFWRPHGELKTNLRPNLKPGHWKFNPQNWNTLAGFLKYLVWDSTRLTVDEAVVRHGQRILVWKTR
jgi:hypothetical protein